MTTRVRRFAQKAPIFLLALAPVGYLAWAAYAGALSANPISDITNETGVWTLRFLAVTLAITPMRRLTGWNWVIRYRRMFGLFAFFYGSLHFLTDLWLDQFFDLGGIVKDVAKRPFITVGFAAFLAMLPLAITSTKGWIRRLGGRRWQALHRLAYVAAAAGVIHYWWLVKADTIRPIRYGIVVGLLLGIRAGYRYAGVRSHTPRRLPITVRAVEE
jgi:sulfoxide reductase heme-binding subunit YedZ